MTQLHETLMGRRLIEGTLPDIADQLKRIADSLEKLVEKDLKKYNDLVELERGAEITNKF